MNILLIHQHFNTPESGGPVRSYYLATALVQKGHRVVVITAASIPKTLLTTVEGIEVIYLPIPYNNRFPFYSRAWSFLRFAWSASRAAKRYKEFDLCYAISVPLTVGLSAQWIKWRFGIPYWFEVGDLWPDAPIQLGYLTNPLLKRLLFSFERSVYRQARGVTALTESIRDAILAKVPGCRTALIPNMADCDFYRPQPRNPEVASRYQAEGKFVISYVGTLGAANGLEHLIRCAEESQRAGLPVVFILCGDGAMLESLKADVARRSLKNVRFTGFVNRNTVREVLNVSDASFVSYRPAPILETGCPNKYFDGLAAGKLIILNFGGWIRKEVEETGCGFFVDPAEPNSFIVQLKPYLTDSARLEQAQRRSRKLAEDKYSRPAISARFAATLAS